MALFALPFRELLPGVAVASMVQWFAGRPLRRYAQASRHRARHGARMWLVSVRGATTTTAGEPLQSERSYVTRVLPRAVVAVFTWTDHGGPGPASAMIMGLGVTTAGYM